MSRTNPEGYGPDELYPMVSAGEHAFFSVTLKGHESWLPFLSRAYESRDYASVEWDRDGFHHQYIILRIIGGCSVEEIQADFVGASAAYCDVAHCTERQSDKQFGLSCRDKLLTLAKDHGVIIYGTLA